MYTGDYARAANLVKKGLETIRIVGNVWWAIYHQSKLIKIYLAQGDYAEATRLAEKALAEAQKIARNEIVEDYLGLLQAIAWSQGDYARATQLGQESIQISQENPILRFDTTIYYYRGRTALSQGDFLQAEKFIRMALADLFIKAKVLPGCAVLFCQQGKHPQAARIFAAIHARFEWERLGLPPRERSEHDGALAATRLALGEEAFAADWAEGQALTLEQALEIALEVLRGGEEK
jgi:tetratricopeptide (TPR) repeat protein